MRLRFVDTVHFGKSELTNFRSILLRYPHFIAPHRNALRPDDVVLLVSKMGNQLVFLHGFDMINATQVLRSTRLRIDGGARWNPLMLVNYARQVGLVITGLQAYEAHVRALLHRA